MPKSSPYRVLFVCLGNICRSPLAEVVFRHLVTTKKLQSRFKIESCGTGSWHIGQGAHSGTKKIAKKYGLSADGHCARQIEPEDFERFDLIVAMDRQNLADLKAMARDTAATLLCLREFDSEKGNLDVPDPYYGSTSGFEEVYAIVSRSCDALLSHLLKKLDERA